MTETPARPDALKVVTQQFGAVTLRACLPRGMKVKQYVPNHHFIELEDADGNTVMLPAVSLIKGVCTICAQEMWVKSRLGDMKCLHCQGTVNWLWGHGQLAFVPERESRFSSVPPPPKAVEPTVDLDKEVEEGEVYVEEDPTLS